MSEKEKAKFSSFTSPNSSGIRSKKHAWLLKDIYIEFVLVDIDFIYFCDWHLKRALNSTLGKVTCSLSKFCLLEFRFSLQVKNGGRWWLIILKSKAKLAQVNTFGHSFIPTSNTFKVDKERLWIHPKSHWNFSYWFTMPSPNTCQTYWLLQKKNTKSARLILLAPRGAFLDLMVNPTCLPLKLSTWCSSESSHRNRVYSRQMDTLLEAYLSLGASLRTKWLVKS